MGRSVSREWIGHRHSNACEQDEQPYAREEAAAADSFPRRHQCAQSELDPSNVSCCRSSRPAGRLAGRLGSANSATTGFRAKSSLDDEPEKDVVGGTGTHD
jgi:hypothetical protein